MGGKWQIGIHKRISELGIDAIAYFHVSDLNAGIEVRSSYSTTLAKRGIKNLALFKITKDGVSLYLTEFNKEPSFYSTGQPAWRINAIDLDQCLVGLYREVGQSRLKLRNHLIAQVPEHFDDLPLIKGNRMEEFARDLKLDKLAILQLPKINSSENGIGSESIVEYNNRLFEDSTELVKVMEEYPFQYAVLPYQEDLDALRTQGFQFVLYQIHDSGKSIKNYLNYPVNDSETDYISVCLSGEKPSLKTIPIDDKVYKYYVKHIYSKDVYVGKDWDADPDWEVALMNFIRGLKIATKVK